MSKVLERVSKWILFPRSRMNSMVQPSRNQPVLIPGLPERLPPYATSLQSISPHLLVQFAGNTIMSNAPSNSSVLNNHSLDQPVWLLVWLGCRLHFSRSCFNFSLQGPETPCCSLNTHLKWKRRQAFSLLRLIWPVYPSVWPTHKASHPLHLILKHKV